ncbi:hypothetical protein [Maribacter sp. 2307ULW6-5]|uniref:hypothetical protein n=1 Tax=Maribacter sp. 2307ULW6-5 TaxID=3386275 RepID=UPI0039BC79A2
MDDTPETYRFNLSFVNTEAVYPLMDFARETVEECENLRLILSLNEGMNEFIEHSYYYLTLVSYYNTRPLHGK